MKYASEVWSTLRYHFFKLLTPLVIASLISRKRDCSAILSHRLIMNSRDGIIRQIVGERSLEKVCWILAGSYILSVMNLTNEVIDLPSEPREGLPACPILFWRVGSQRSSGSYWDRALYRLHRPAIQTDLLPRADQASVWRNVVALHGLTFLKVKNLSRNL